MLRRLTVKNYAIIRELDMGFGEGFTVITGETGAGKSILLGALGLALGERADTSVLLSQDEKCIVEADFDIRGYDLETLFEESGVDYEDDAILRREITPAGKSRAFINDTPVTLNVMKELGTRLIDVHSQHQTLLLGNSMFQLRVIDAYAGAAALSGEYRNAWGRYLRAKRAFDDAAGDAERERADYDYYSHQLEELQAARLTEGEQEALEQEQERLTNAGEIREALTTVTTALSGDGPSALSLLRTVRNSLAKISGWLPGAALLEKRIDAQLIDLNDISYEAEKLNGNTADDPGRLEQVTARLDTIWSLMQKHRCRDLSELLARQEQIAGKVSLTAGVDERITDLKKRADEAYAAVTELAGRLSAARREAVGPFTREITAMLRKLGMPHARFETELIPSDMPGPSGLEKAEFMFSANRQVAPEELSRCASGGELSRVMLCLKSVLASSSGLPAIIFDEIDSGVSGEVASMVGDILEEMGRSMQVINITHLPQVASRGTLHYHVYKEESDHSTNTRVRLLNSEERIQEIARLLSGSTVTEAAVRNARELLGSN
ncbi:MAG: DNA repair protein RecN [Bacteroidales bacterium]|jgi:DNA repair protein RecN (Recombination protein N)|nr:DNA repair protein RecN [Bacteroidales bacterium]